jgi:hypothetical protein
MDRGISELLGIVEGLLRQQAALERQWMGRRVRLVEPFGQLPAGAVLIEAGTVGEVAKIRLVQEAPLVVRFAGVVYQVAPLPYMLEVVEDD